MKRKIQQYQGLFKSYQMEIPVLLSTKLMAQSVGMTWKRDHYSQQHFHLFQLGVLILLILIP